MKKYLVILTLAVVCGYSCKSFSAKPSARDIAQLTEKYSAETINYFYETVYYQDYKGPVEKLRKWNSDILIHIDGELWPNDLEYVESVIAQLNELELPIKLRWAPTEAEANLFLYFGDYEYLENQLELDDYVKFVGIGKIDGPNSRISKGRVGFANEATRYSAPGVDTTRIRQAVILEEISQMLGVCGDSWSDSRSVFFEGHNDVPELSEKDKSVLRFLYERCIPAGYSRVDFERDFEHMLYHRNTPDKIAAYVLENNIPLSYLEHIRDNCFPDSLLVKFPNRINLVLDGDHTNADSLFCVRLSEELSGGGNLNLRVGNDGEQVPVIRLTYTFDPKAGDMIYAEFNVRSGTAMFPQRLIGEFKVRFGKYPDSDDKQQKRDRLVATTFFKALGLDGISANDSIPYSEYYDMLNLLYASELYSGIRLEDFNTVIETVRIGALR